MSIGSVDKTDGVHTIDGGSGRIESTDVSDGD